MQKKKKKKADQATKLAIAHNAHNAFVNGQVNIQVNEQARPQAGQKGYIFCFLDFYLAF